MSVRKIRVFNVDEIDGRSQPYKINLVLKKK